MLSKIFLFLFFYLFKGFLFTYIAPLVFVLSITISKEAWDDFQRYRRDKEANNQMYVRLTEHGRVPIPSSDIKVGMLIVIDTNQRVPAGIFFSHPPLHPPYFSSSFSFLYPSIDYPETCFCWKQLRRAAVRLLGLINWMAKLTGSSAGRES